MSLLRTSNTLTLVSRAATQQRAMLASVRTYADAPGSGSGSAGATAGSKGWKEKEQAQENQYFRNAEVEKLKKLKESLEVQRQHLAEMEKEFESLRKGDK